mgnify:CR=1 FL=1
MKCKIEISMNNAAFEDSGELARILNKAAELVSGDPETMMDGSVPLRDINGNTVGYIEIDEEA